MFDLQTALAKGMYVELLDDWFKLFAREQFLVLNFETYMDDKFSMLHRIYAFLDTGKISMLRRIYAFLDTGKISMLHRIYAFLDTGKIPTKHKDGLR